MEERAQMISQNGALQASIKKAERHLVAYRGLKKHFRDVAVKDMRSCYGYVDPIKEDDGLVSIDDDRAAESVKYVAHPRVNGTKQRDSAAPTGFSVFLQYLEEGSVEDGSQARKLLETDRAILGAANQQSIINQSVSPRGIFMGDSLVSKWESTALVTAIQNTRDAPDFGVIATCLIDEYRIDQRPLALALNRKICLFSRCTDYDTTELYRQDKSLNDIPPARRDEIVENAISIARHQVLARATFLNHQDIHQRTALIWASRRGHLDIVCKLLTSENIDVDLADDLGRTALIWAAQKGHHGVVKALLDAKTQELAAHPFDAKTMNQSQVSTIINSSKTSLYSMCLIVDLLILKLF